MRVTITAEYPNGEVFDVSLEAPDSVDPSDVLGRVTAAAFETVPASGPPPAEEDKPVSTKPTGIIAIDLPPASGPLTVCQLGRGDDECGLPAFHGGQHSWETSPVDKCLHPNLPKTEDLIQCAECNAFVKSPKTVSA